MFIVHKPIIKLINIGKHIIEYKILDIVQQCIWFWLHGGFNKQPWSFQGLKSLETAGHPKQINTQIHFYLVNTSVNSNIRQTNHRVCSGCAHIQSGSEEISSNNAGVYVHIFNFLVYQRHCRGLTVGTLLTLIASSFKVSRKNALILLLIACTAVGND